MCFRVRGKRNEMYIREDKKPGPINEHFFSAVPFHEDHMTYRGELAELPDWGQFEVSKASTGYYSSSTSSTFKFSRNSSSSKKPEPNPKRHNVFNCYEKFTTQAAWGLVATHPMRYVWMITFLMIKVFFVGAVIRDGKIVIIHK